MQKASTTLKYCLFFVLSACILSASCKKQTLLTSGGSLRFSTDTLSFDTVFTAQGSYTASVKIYNPQNQKVNISSIRLQSGSSSYFHLNVDGYKSNDVSNIEIAAHDSIYVFATVNIDPTNANSPFVIDDALVATLNGKDFILPFEAYGQNAHYIIDSLLETQTWDTDKPYVILHNAFVDSMATLTIPAGCRVYMHADSRLYILNYGRLIAQGTKSDSIIFQGDRLDRFYFGEGRPGEWGGLYFDSYSNGSILDHVLLVNCGAATPINGGMAQPAAIQVNPDKVIGSSAPQLTINHTTIQNSEGFGLLSFGGTVVLQNTLIHTCSSQALAILQGGNYIVNNCTFAVYNTDNISHTTSGNTVAAILNYFDTSNTGYLSAALNATFTNCVIWGSLNNECFINRKSGAAMNVTLSHCFIKDTIPSYVLQNTVTTYTDPQFADTVKLDFHLKPSSPMIGAGQTVTYPGDNFDLDNIPRTAPYDIGCYQHH